MAIMAYKNPAMYPFPMSHPLYEYIIDPSQDHATKMYGIKFRSVLGAQLYLLTLIRLDISTTVRMIAKSQSKPKLKHWKMLKLLSYIS